MSKKISFLGMFLALALILSYVESLIPFSFGIPGVKLGLTNIVIVFMLYFFGPTECLLVTFFRAVLSGFLFGNVFSIIYSLAGCLLSFAVMYKIKKTGKFKPISISLLGGIFHNIGQLIVAAVIVETYSIIYYIPVLIFAGAITGLVIGIISQEVILRVNSNIEF